MKRKLARVQTVLNKFTAMKDRPLDFQVIVLGLLMIVLSVISFRLIVTIAEWVHSI